MSPDQVTLANSNPKVVRSTQLTGAGGTVFNREDAEAKKLLD